MSEAARIVVKAKLESMATHLDFLEYAWNGLSQFERDKFINNYDGHVPRKYKR